MYLVLIAWLYVALMMAIAEAVSPVGTVLGAIITFVLYGVLPMSVVGYILNSPARRRARLAAQAQDPEQPPVSVVEPNASRESSAAPVSAVGKELR